MELAEEGPQTYEKIAEVMGFNGKSGAEAVIRSALRSFARAALRMGMPELVGYLEPVTVTDEERDE